jgi:hypothetical protein
MTDIKPVDFTLLVRSEDRVLLRKLWAAHKTWTPKGSMTLGDTRYADFLVAQALEFGYGIAVEHLDTQAAELAQSKKEAEQAKLEVLTLRDALEMLYDRYENGVSVSEDCGDGEFGASMGNAVKLSEEEENAVLHLIPSVLNDNGKSLPSTAESAAKYKSGIETKVLEEALMALEGQEDTGSCADAIEALIEQRKQIIKEGVK